MKKRIVSIIAVLLIALLTLSIVSCGSGAKENDSMSYEDMAPGSSVENGKTEDTFTTTTGDGSKMIKTANISAETKDYAKSTDDLKALITSLGGHISNSSASENASYRGDGTTEKNANYTIKIPAESFDSFTNSLDNIVNVVNLSTSTQDVSESYFTLQARISTLESKREGLVTMLKNVDVNTDFTTWQKINAELTEIDTQLNIYNEQLKSLDNQVTYSTVTLSLREVVEYTEEEKPYGEEVKEAFNDGMTGIVELFKGLFLVVLILLPFILVWGGFIVIVIVIIRVCTKKKKAKNEKKNENK